MLETKIKGRFEASIAQKFLTIADLQAQVAEVKEKVLMEECKIVNTVQVRRNLQVEADLLR